MEKVKTIKAIEEVIEYFETEIVDDYVLEMGDGVMSKPYLKEGIVSLIVSETKLPPKFVQAAVDLIYKTEVLE